VGRQRHRIVPKFILQVVRGEEDTDSQSFSLLVMVSAGLRDPCHIPPAHTCKASSSQGQS
jgi:hypothetical protein